MKSQYDQDSSCESPSWPHPKRGNPPSMSSTHPANCHQGKRNRRHSHITHVRLFACLPSQLQLSISHTSPGFLNGDRHQGSNQYLRFLSGPEPVLATWAICSQI